MTNSGRVKYSVTNSPTFFMNGDTEVTSKQINNRKNRKWNWSRAFCYYLIYIVIVANLILDF